MVKREYEPQEPIAVAVDRYTTFIQSTPDHVVNFALKIVTGEMWSSAAGTGAPGKGQNFLSQLARYINPQAKALRNTALAGHSGTRPFTGIAIVGAVFLKNRNRSYAGSPLPEDYAHWTVTKPKLN